MSELAQFTTTSPIIDSHRDKHGVPVDYKAATALGTVLRASESRRKPYGVDTPTKLTTRFQPEMTDEQAPEIIIEYEALRGCTCSSSPLFP